jgi:hypothetical protein
VKKLSAAAAILILAMAGVGCGTGSGGGSHLVSIDVSPSPVNMTAPQTLQLQAIGTYSDGTTKALPNASWTLSGAQGTITVSGSGLANCAMPGALPSLISVTASFAGISGSAPVTCAGVIG